MVHLKSKQMNVYGDLPLLEIQLQLHSTWYFPMAHQEQISWRKLQPDAESAVQQEQGHYYVFYTVPDMLVYLFRLQKYLSHLN